MEIIGGLVILWIAWNTLRFVAFWAQAFTDIGDESLWRMFILGGIGLWFVVYIINSIN